MTNIPRQFAMPLPDRMKSLPVDKRGFPVPWFVTWFEDGKPCRVGTGEPDFRIVDPRNMMIAVRDGQCWICGKKMGSFKAFVIGPMCAINRTISEPPSHLECARFAARVCPFLSQPRMKRNERGLEGFVEPAGVGLKRNPGVACVWVTREFTIFRPGRGGGSHDGVLFRLGEPIHVEWWAESLPASRAQVDASIASGLSSLQSIADEEGPAATAELARFIERAEPLLPKEKH